VNERRSAGGKASAATPIPTKAKTTTPSPSNRGQTTTYAINGLGERIAKSSNQAIEYVYDSAGHLIGEYDDKGNAIEETVWLGDLPVVTVDASGPHYINSDHLGSPHIITDSANHVLWTWAHAPFGDTQPVAFRHLQRFALLAWLPNVTLERSSVKRQ
jgi:uncharacterized protein RhaS with RHS repeats